MNTVYILILVFYNWSVVDVEEMDDLELPSCGAGGGRGGGGDETDSTSGVTENRALMTRLHDADSRVAQMEEQIQQLLSVVSGMR